MHVTLATFGTDGDVFPYIGLGRHLISRGHKVTLVTSGHYAKAAAENGLGFCEMISRDEIDSVIWNPDFWHPLKAGPMAAKWGLKFIPRQYELLSDLVKEPGSALVANPGVLAARLVNEKYGTPFASVVLQPWVIPSVEAPPILPGGMALPQWAPKWAVRMQLDLVTFGADLLLAPTMNKFRRELGLPKIRKVLKWWLSPRLILAFFPAWFGKPQPDWLPQIRTLAFPDFDGSVDRSLDPEIEAFLKAGEPPVAITFGTGIRHATKLYKAAIEGCHRAGRRGIVLTKYDEQVPQPLPPGLFHARYAPFGGLFPRCAGVVHHGGIGTTAKALAARVPQLIIPVCFDQLDNGHRVQALGAGKWLALRKANPNNVAEGIKAILSSSDFNRTPAASTEKCSAYEMAAPLIEALR